MRLQRGDCEVNGYHGHAGTLELPSDISVSLGGSQGKGYTPETTEKQTPEREELREGCFPSWPYYPRALALRVAFLNRRQVKDELEAKI
jgi:hypothetical protein